MQEVTRTIQIIVEEVLGKSRKSIMDKDIRWWKKEVQEVTARKKKELSTVTYNEVKRAAKKVVSETRTSRKTILLSRYKIGNY